MQNGKKEVQENAARACVTRQNKEPCTEFNVPERERIAWVKMGRQAARKDSANPFISRHWRRNTPIPWDGKSYHQAVALREWVVLIGGNRPDCEPCPRVYAYHTKKKLWRECRPRPLPAVVLQSIVNLSSSSAVNRVAVMFSFSMWSAQNGRRCRSLICQQLPKTVQQLHLVASCMFAADHESTTGRFRCSIFFVKRGQN